MPKAVRFDEYGGTEVLRVVDVAIPEPAAGEVLVEVRATAINPGEAKIRSGALHDIFPAVFPSGQGSDLAGVVTATGPGVTGFAPGDEVTGFTNRRAAHAEYAIVLAEDLTAKPPALSWEVAGSLYVVGTTAYAAVRAVAPRPGETVVVSGAAGGVGLLAVQLARRAGAEVVGIAGPANHDWLTAHGVTPVAYGEGLPDRLRAAADRVDAFIDTHGDGYVDLAVGLGVAPGRIDTIADFAAAGRVGARTEGNNSAARAEVIAELAALAAAGDLDLPIAATYPLAEVRAAYEELAGPHPRGKIVLLP